MMSRLMRRLATVNDWNDTISVNNATALALCFTALPALESIYIPVKIPTSEGMPDDYTYQKIGYSSTELADVYNTYYGQNYWIEPLIDNDDQYVQSIAKMAKRIESVYRLNMSKYLKLIELGGYTYNPLWNVDGVEEYTFLENNGTNDITTTKTNAGYTDQNSNTRTGGETIQENHEDTNSVTSFDSTEFNDTGHNVGNSTTTKSNNSITDSGSTIHGAHTDTDATTVTHHNALNGESEYSGGTDTFGNTVVGGDKYHNERKVRQGNIGVTKTQELIAAERENLKFSVIMEFFKDINEQILVGIY